MLFGHLICGWYVRSSFQSEFFASLYWRAVALYSCCPENQWKHIFIVVSVDGAAPLFTRILFIISCRLHLVHFKNKIDLIPRETLRGFIFYFSFQNFCYNNVSSSCYKTMASRHTHYALFTFASCRTNSSVHFIEEQSLSYQVQTKNIQEWKVVQSRITNLSSLEWPIM